MKIQSLSLHSYQIPLTTGQTRSGVVVHLTDEKGNAGWGDIAPLPTWSKETLEQSLSQVLHLKQELLQIDWDVQTYFKTLKQLYPSVTFGLESALLSIFKPLPIYTTAVSALLMGSPKQILEQAKLRLSEGYTSAKLKVSNLSFDDTSQLIHQLKDQFYLRIDVNRAWETEKSLRFFSEFPLDTFDYVEEPFKNPKELIQFMHPLAVDESFPENLSYSDLEALPTLKALIYKPTIQGGLLGCLALDEWAKKRGIHLILSSCFESDVGLMNIASIACRLSLPSPIGIGTYHYMSSYVCAKPLEFSRANLSIQPDNFRLKD